MILMSKDLETIIKIQEEIIRKNNQTIKYYKAVSHWMMHEAFEQWSANFRIKGHNYLLFKYANSLWNVFQKTNKKKKKGGKK